MSLINEETEIWNKSSVAIVFSPVRGGRRIVPGAPICDGLGPGRHLGHDRPAGQDQVPRAADAKIFIGRVISATLVGRPERGDSYR